MDSTSQEKLDIETKMLTGGYKTYKTSYFETKSYKKLRETMLENLPKNKPQNINFKFLTKNDILNAGRYVIDKHFGHLDLRIPFTNGDALQTELVAQFGLTPKPQDYDEIIKYINNHIELVRVTDIPLYINVNESQNGYESETRFYSNKIMEKTFFKNLSPCIHEIAVEGDCDENTRCIYVHEMAHALINRQKGSVRNMLNKEVFSIFMERIAARDLESDPQFLDLNIFQRILRNKYSMLNMEFYKYIEEDFQKILNDKAYILSTLHATALFDIYIKKNNKIRKEIDTSLGEVITGKKVLEDVLDYYEATLEKGSIIMQKQIKNYEKKFN